ncbi:MAG TPA: NAD(P)/FAD-dependent oxidoreductase [Thermoplasmata archaeon]|nr:NAD(P)/FAD-dependent oxidoreductase [Thermoplasmata archaeon]
MEAFDALVVGGGPAGSTFAERLSRRGHRVLLVEEHDRIGYPIQCAGLVSQRVLDLAGSDRFVLGRVRGATVYGPRTASVTFRAPTPRAFVIHRAELDRHLADRAAAAGATVWTGWRFDRAQPPSDGRVVVEGRTSPGHPESLSARLVVGADGVASAVARALRLRRPVEILPAFEAEFPESPGDPEEVEVYLGLGLAPGLFGWSIPDGAGGARVGVAARADGTPARRYFDRLLEAIERRVGRRLRNPTSYLVSGIPIGSVPRTSAPHGLLVGDAAAQVKPLSGGGIYTGMRCAEIAADVAGRALTSGDLGAAALGRYDRAWRAELGDELNRTLYLRRLFLRLSDDDLEAIVGTLDRAELKGTIVAFGDIDFPSGVARQLLRESPSLLRLFPKALGALWASGSFQAPELEPAPFPRHAK